MGGDALSAGDALLDALAERLASRVAAAVVARLRTDAGLGAPLYATAKKNPCGSRKAFLRGLHAKAFPSFKHGRELAADWVVVEAWWKSLPTQGPSKDDLNEDALRAELQSRLPKRS